MPSSSRRRPKRIQLGGTPGGTVGTGVDDDQQITPRLIGSSYAWSAAEKPPTDSFAFQDAPETPWMRNTSGEKSDNTWRRLRTPSPEPTYMGQPPIGFGLADFVPNPYMGPWTGSSHWWVMSANTPVDNLYGHPVVLEMCREEDTGGNSASAASDIQQGETLEEAMECQPCREEESVGKAPSSQSADLDLLEIINEADAPSKGSIGHPSCCAQPCKYVKKQRGCKDGADCVRCHLCVFKNSKSKKPSSSSQEEAPNEEIAQ